MLAKKIWKARAGRKTKVCPNHHKRTRRKETSNLCSGPNCHRKRIEMLRKSSRPTCESRVPRWVIAMNATKHIALLISLSRTSFFVSQTKAETGLLARARRSLALVATPKKIGNSAKTPMMPLNSSRKSKIHTRIRRSWLRKISMTRRCVGWRRFIRSRRLNACWRFFMLLKTEPVVWFYYTPILLTSSSSKGFKLRR